MDLDDIMYPDTDLCVVQDAAKWTNITHKSAADKNYTTCTDHLA